MVSEDGETSKLFWKGQHIGDIAGVTWSDFPWRSGQFISLNVTDEVRAIIEWFASMEEAEELKDPPFAEEALSSWWIETLDGSRRDLETAPLIDLEEGTVEWRLRRLEPLLRL